jgi:4-amino-4-deoxy-L-arabinose transferase-like glycosyltransferase
VRLALYRSKSPTIIGHDAALLTLAGVLVFVVLFWRLGEPTFWDPDEAHYAETTREMIQSGDWWAPYYNEQPFFDKPVLFHQLQAASMLAFGQNELGARMLPAVAALILIGITAWFGASMTSIDIGVVAGLLLAASPGVFGLARYAILDTLFTMFLFGGAALLATAALRDRPYLQWPGYLCLALAVLTKGPVGLALCGLTLLLAVLTSRDLRRSLLGLHWIAGLTMVILVAAPWFVYMFLRFRVDFVNGYLLDENVRLFAASRFGNQPPFWFYFQILALGLLPWTGLVIGRAVDDVRALARGERLDGFEVLLWTWTTAIVGFFTLSTFKLDHYVFPAAPSLCLLCARAWSDIRADPRSSRHAASRFGLWTAGPLLAVLGVACGYFLVVRLALPPLAMAIPVALTLAGLAMAAGLGLRGGSLPRIPWLVMIALLVTYVGLVHYVMPAIERQKVVDDVAAWVAGEARPDDRIGSYRLNRWTPSFRFHIGRHVEFLEDPHEAEAFFELPEPFFCVMRREALDEFLARGVKLDVRLERRGMWATSGRVLWRNQVPTARFVVVTKPR